jgi:hypothetical protein
MINLKNFTVCGLSFMLLGCSGGDNILNLNKRPPDEFSIVSNPPLYVPPSFDLNDPNKESLKVKMADKSELDSSEKKFLSLLKGKHSADLSHENDEENTGKFHKFISKIKGKKPADVVDPHAEKERIEKNIQAGVPVNQGVTKSRKEGGSTLDKIIGHTDGDN